MAAKIEFSAQSEVGTLGLPEAGGRVVGSDITCHIINVSASHSSQAEKAGLLTEPTRHSFQPPTAAAAAPETPAAEVPVLAVSQITAALCQLAISQVGTSNVQNAEENVSDIRSHFLRDEARFLAGADYIQTQTDITGEDRTILIDWVVGVHAKYRLRPDTFLAGADYMETQTDITGEDRSILIDWVVGVHAKYRLCPETLHLTVNLIDRYLTRMPILSGCLLLVGVVAMFIASKSEEVRPPDSEFEVILPPELHARRSHRPISPRDWACITNNACTKDDILVMEWTMLSALSFQIVVPTAANFFDVFEKANLCNAVHLEVALYLLELALLDLRSLRHNPSQMVAAALLLSNKIFRRSTVWPAHMVHQTRHTEQSLGSCAEVLRELLEADRAVAGGQPRAVYKKFDAALRLAIAKMRF